MRTTHTVPIGTALFLAGVLLFIAAAGSWASPYPAITFSTGEKKYMLTEFFTGTWCTACPWGAMELKEYENKLGNLVVISYHENDPMSTTEGTSYINLVKTTLYPSAIFDRTVFPGQYSLTLGRADWDDFITTAVSASPGFTITAVCGLSEADRTVTLDIEAVPLRDLTKKYRLNVIVTEDSLNYRQSMSPSETPEVYPYYHLHVFRKTLTGTTGEPFIDAAVKKGTSLKKSYSFTLDKAISTKNASIAVFIHENQVNNIGVVEQALKIPMKSLLTPTAVKENNDLPSDFAITGNHPNPFNPSTTIEYALPAAGMGDLAIYSVTGQKVRELVNGIIPEGKHSVVWDGRDDRGMPVSSGIYFSRLRMGEKTTAGRMMLVK